VTSSGGRQPGEDRGGRDAGNWAASVERLRVTDAPGEAAGINVDGRRVSGPVQGFGRLWRKTYLIRLEGVTVTPAEVIAVWKQRFSEFWPAQARFYAPLTGMAPGGVALIDNQLAGGLRLSTGVMVMYADEESFAVMAAEGMPFAGWNTFSAYDADGVTVAQVQLLMRASDPLFELALTLGGHRMEDLHWQRTLRNLAAHFGVEGVVATEAICVDRRLQWSRAGNVWRNAAVRTALHTLAAPVRGRRRASGPGA
jgi:hypothetical protein